MNRDKLRKRIQAISTALSGTFPARLAKLSEAERAAYEEWQRCCDRWIAHFNDPSDAYAALANGDDGPQLPKSIHGKLFEPAPVVPANATLEQVAEIYARMVGGN